MSPFRVPEAPEAISAEWLGHVLGCEVSAVRVRRFSEDRGFTSALAVVEYGAGRRCVAKIGPASDGGARELAFYRRLAPRVPVRIPRFLYGETDPETDRTIVLLEHVAPASKGDNLDGCEPERSAALLRALARLHVAFWGDALADETWLARYDDPGEAIDRLTRRKDRFLDLHGDRLPPAVRNRCATIDDDAPAIWEALAAAPPTLLHDDFHLDNVLFEGETPVILDWHGAAVGAAAIDVARFLVECVTVEQRRALGDSWLTIYLDALRAEGVAYDREAMRKDARNGLLRCLVGLTGSKFCQIPPGEMPDRMRRLVVGSVERVGSAVADHA